MRWMLVAMVVGCGGSERSYPAVAGTYSGKYTSMYSPNDVFTGTMVLTQDGGHLTGSLHTDEPRSGIVALSFTDGNDLSGTVNFTDACGGTANLLATVKTGPDRIEGNYLATDCVAVHGGGYILNKELAKQ
jgi:hypothetical protein